jgi:uncharacterized repeat protein (TIGR01451 family)
MLGLLSEWNSLPARTSLLDRCKQKPAQPAEVAGKARMETLAAKWRSRWIGMICRLLLAACALAEFQYAHPRLALSGEHDWMHAATVETTEYPGPPRFWNKSGLVISPARSLAQVGTEVPLFAGVCDGKGQLQPYEKIEWLLDHSGVGSFVSVSEAYRPFYLDLFSKKPTKIDNNYAWAETLPVNVILTRGTPQITDDMVMPRGYTWVTVTSPREGISYITAYAPDVYSWDMREKSSTIYWIDAEWTFPEPACVPIGEHALLTTCVRRHTTKAPVSDWIVKYCITGGVDATFHDGSKSTEVATDAEGRSTVEVIPTTGNNGATCISMELIRSECAPQGEPERLSIATAATQVNWAIKDGEATPAAAVPATPPAALPSTPPPAAAPVAPPITRPSLPPTTSPPVQPATPAAPVQPVPVPKIGLNVTGPETAQPGTDIRFILEVTNTGNAVSPELMVTDRYDQGLEYAVKANPLQNKLGVIQPGEKKQVGITFRVTRAGKLCNVVEVTGPPGSNIHETKQVCVNVMGEPAPPEQPAISLGIAAPQKAYTVGQHPLFTIDVANTGSTTAAQQVRLVVHLDPQLHADQATDGFQRTADGGVQFTIDSIPPGKHEQRQVLCTCTAPSANACGRVTYSDASQLNLGQEACLSIQPAPAAAAPQSNLQVQIRAINNPVKAGATAVFRVTVTNAGTNPERNVRLSLTLPESFTYVRTIAPVGVSTTDGPNIQFEPVLELRPQEPIPFDVTLRATNNPGPAQVTAQVTSANQTQPLTDSATTTIFAQ